MSAPLAKGLIIAASLVVAAGVALYENEDFRIWFDERRRRIAIVFRDVANNIHPDMAQRPQEHQLSSYDRALDIVRRNREELIRKAREQGISVDLDELAAVGQEEIELHQQRARNATDSTNASQISFDSFIKKDGTLISREAQSSSTAIEPSNLRNPSLRHRSNVSRGVVAGSSFANPFEDESHILFDQDIIAPSEHEFCAANAHVSASTNTSSASIGKNPGPISIPITDLEVTEPNSAQYKTDDELNAEITYAIHLSMLEAEKQRRIQQASGEIPMSPSYHEDSFPAQSPRVEDNQYHPPPIPSHYVLERREDGTQTPKRCQTPTALPDHETSASGTSITSSTMFESAISSPPSTIFEDDLRHAQRETRSETVQPESQDTIITSPQTRNAELHDDTESLIDYHSLSSNDDLFDLRSESGHSEAFSMVSGRLTPTSWTDVDTDIEEEQWPTNNRPNLANRTGPAN